MHAAQLAKFFGITLTYLAAFSFLAAPAQAETKPTKSPKPAQLKTATKAKAPSEKERVVLMPLRVSEEEVKLQGAMETALVEGLQKKYEVFSGEQVAQKANEIFKKESRNTAKKECDETRCMQDIAESFQAELIATANVSKQGETYFLALTIQNIFDNLVVYSKSEPCERCTSAQVVNKLKELSGTITPTSQAEIDRQLKEAEEARLKSEAKRKFEDARQAELSAEERRKAQESTEYQRLLTAETEDRQKVAALIAQAEARRTKAAAQPTPTDFPTVQSAVAEIKHLNERIQTIKQDYATKVTQTRAQIEQRYAKQFNNLAKLKKGEYESTADFENNKTNKRNELSAQQKEELAKVPSTASLSDPETTPLRERIQSLSEREYEIGAENIAVALAPYDADKQNFSLSLTSKSPDINLKISGALALPPTEAKAFQLQWKAGLVHAEAKVKTDGNVYALTLINDEDNSRRTNEDGVFLTTAEKEAKQKRIEAAKEAKRIADEKAHEEWVRNAPQREAAEKAQKERNKASRMKAISFTQFTQGLYEKGSEEGAGGGTGPLVGTTFVVGMSPFAILSDVISTPFKTTKLVNIYQEAALRPSTWGKPDSMIARASRQIKLNPAIESASPTIVAAR